MYSKIWTKKSTSGCSDTIRQLARELDKAQAIVIGAGAGLSASAGFTYTGERFEAFFSDFIEKYHFPDMYTGGFFPFDSPEEYWGYWSRYIYINRYMDAPRPVYETICHLVKDKDYFVLTTNVDHCFQKAGFDKNRLFYTQGDYGLFQCSVPCHQNTWDNETAILQMVREQQNRAIPSRLIPRCPVCGEPAAMNLRADASFVEDSGWQAAAERYKTFLHSHRDLPLLFLELGVGMNTPGIIKYPFWQMTAENTKATYVCVNNGEAVCPQEIAEQSICINGDIGEVLKWL